MKKGINIWAIPANSIESAFKMAKAAGYDGVEVAMDEGGWINPESGRTDMQHIKALAANEGLSLYSVASGFYWNHSLTSDDPEERKLAENAVKKQLDVASWLECDTILIVPGMVTNYDYTAPVVAYDTVYDRSLDALTRLAPYAEARGVTIGLENVWNHFLLSPTEMRDFIDKVNSPNVGSYLDVGNVIRDGYPDQWVRILGDRIAKVHFKDYRRSIGSLAGFVHLLQGDANYPAIMSALADVGYDGWVTAEFGANRQYPEALLNSISQAMDFILGRK